MYNREVYAATPDDFSNHIEDSPLQNIIDAVFDKYRQELTPEQSLIASQNYFETSLYGAVTAVYYSVINQMAKPKNGKKKEKRPNKNPKTNGHAGTSKTTGKKTRFR